MNHFRILFGLALGVSALTLNLAAASLQPRPFQVPAQAVDAAEILSPGDLHVEGWLGRRIDLNEKNRLLQVDLEPLLAGFRKKPGTHPWIGEHIGKWMHAATLAWAYTGDAALRAKLDYAAAELVKAQEPDGYLGTYVPDKRFGLYNGADWDVWSHKYNLLGLLTYAQYTGNEAALQAGRKIGDLLIATFPARRSILAAGTHVGMAATSVLEPVVLLYRLTGQSRYLEFARYIVQSWDEPNGPKVLATLLREKQVNKTANGKAYEMLSNLVGLCDLARVTGDRRMLEAVRNAWEDVVAKRLYLTGSASAGEHFQGDYVLPNGTGSHICETCVTTTWIQLNLQLLRLTGQAKYGDELERTFYNHLTAAQHPDGADWCYYTALEGKKPYDSGINCCHSSGPRGVALAPLAAYLKSVGGGQEALLVSTFETSQATLTLGGETVSARQRSGFPVKGETELAFVLSKPMKFAVQWRTPPWAGALKLALNGQSLEAESREGWTTVPARVWQQTDRLTVRFGLEARMLVGDHGNTGRAAMSWGPFVLAYDDKRNADLPKTGLVALADEKLTSPTAFAPGQDLVFSGQLRAPGRAEAFAGTLVPFAEAGRDGGTYRVWLRAIGTPLLVTGNLLSVGQESRSRSGNVGGSIIDGDPDNYVVTFDGQMANEDWFAVTLDEAVSVKRVAFAPGKLFHDGGWFDASAGKPRIEVKRSKGAKWEPLGELATYPATTATSAGSLPQGGDKTFTLTLAEPVKVVAVRIVGKPACGDSPNQAFSSCGELMAYGD